MQLVVLLSVLAFVCVFGKEAPKNDSSLIGLNVVEIIFRCGYPFEEHEVQTEDGYLLAVHRIPPVDQRNKLNKSVLLVPGILSSAADWVNMGSNNSLGFILSSLGYDVWMINPRGTTWSRKHLRFNPETNKEQFWNFSWHEIGYYDLPATIDHILAETGERQLHLVGHSQGTTSFFVMATTRPEYNEKIRLMTAMAPIAFMSNIPNDLLRVIAKYSQSLEWLAKFVGLHEFLPHPELLTTIGKMLCKKDKIILKDFCTQAFFSLGGFLSERIKAEKLLVILTNMPAGASTKQLVHYAQGIVSGKFTAYDYGWMGNLQKYKTITAPEYDLSRVTVPVAFHYSENDQMSSLIDTGLLQEKLPNVVLDRLVPFKLFTHNDFLWSDNVNNLVYNHVIDLLEKY